MVGLATTNLPASLPVNPLFPPIPRRTFLSHLALLQRRTIDIPLRPLTIEGREIRLVERRVLCETLHQVRVGDEGNAEGHRIALASGQPFVGLFLREAFVGDQRAAELLPQLRGQSVVALVFAGEDEG